LGGGEWRLKPRKALELICAWEVTPRQVIARAVFAMAIACAMAPAAGAVRSWAV